MIVSGADGVRLLAQALAEADTIAILTGAGVSTESGIPDFRSPGSPWLRHPPIGFEAFLRSAATRAEAWRRKFAIDDAHGDARPNAGHRALAALVRAGRARAVVTQNIDGLHQAAGLSPGEVIELHGNGTYATCLGCGCRHELADIRPAFEATGEAPECRECGGPVKSATIAFGQAMPAEPVRRAAALAKGCDLFLAVGSSLVVTPAANLPLLARQAGARLVILNRDATALDGDADLVMRGEIGPVLTAATGTATP